MYTAVAVAAIAALPQLAAASPFQFLEARKVSTLTTSSASATTWPTCSPVNQTVTAAPVTVTASAITVTAAPITVTADPVTTTVR